MNIPIIDTHQHLIDPALGAYGWTNGIPQLEGRVFDYAAYLQAIDGTGITQTVFMETTPDNWCEETPHVYGLAEQAGSLISGVISNCQPQAEDFEAQLARIANPRLVGLRRICHVEPDDFSQNPRFRENVRLAGKRDLTFDLCFFARQLPVALELARVCPETQFILDHCGVPDVAAQALDPWRENIRALAGLPNVACKISGVLAYAKTGQATLAAVRPFVEHCIESFGWDRVVWGSDWPVVTMTSSLREWVNVSRELVKNESESNQHKLFHENARRIYRVK
jgi:predicted TIM-barrel fold metal-dependent hydrolase